MVRDAMHDAAGTAAGCGHTVIASANRFLRDEKLPFDNARFRSRVHGC